MNKSRSAYLKVFPLVFLLALVITAMQLYREYHEQTFKDHNLLFGYSTIVLQTAGIWVAVALAVISIIIFFSRLTWSDEALVAWCIALFNFVNLIILLPVFHLYKMKTIQEPPTYVEETEEVGIPIEEA